MSSDRPQDRASLCLFTFTDGRRCRTPRSGSHPHFCFYHARKESKSKTAEKLSDDLSYFFSGDYVSACDLSTAIARLISAVARGDIKPRAATTIAYLAQTLSQTIRLAQHEYINAFGDKAWRQIVHNSVKLNSDYAHPEPAQPAAPHQPKPENPHQEVVGARHVYPACPEERREPRRAVPVPVPAPSPSPATSLCHPERSEGPRHHPTAPTNDETHLASTPCAEPVHLPRSIPPPPESEPASSSATSPARADEALAIARRIFPPRRRTNTTNTADTSTNSFRTNIYESPT
jgi:hypothetical protein